MKQFKLVAVVWFMIGWAGLSEAADVAPKPAMKPGVEPTTYQIRNEKYRELLRPKDANSAEGTRLVLYSPQPWKCMTWKVEPTAEETYSLRNLFTSKTFAPGRTNGAVTPVVQISLGEKPASIPSWRFIRLSDGAYEIRLANSTKVLTAVADADGGGESIVLEDWKNADEQKWELLKIDPEQLTM